MEKLKFPIVKVQLMHLAVPGAIGHFFDLQQDLNMSGEKDQDFPENFTRISTTGQIYVRSWGCVQHTFMRWYITCQYALGKLEPLGKAPVGYGLNQTEVGPDKYVTFPGQNIWL